MNRLRSLAFAFALLLAFPATAAAKSGIGLQGPAPVDLAVGEPWFAVVVAIRADHPDVLPPSAEPGVAISKVGSPERHRFAAHRRRGRTYVARVVFPSPGTWRFRMTGYGSLGAHQDWPPVEVHAAAGSSAGNGAVGADPSSSDAGSGHGGGFPIAWIAAASPVLIALGLFVARRRRAREPRLRRPSPET
jgi:hypothetical protein